MVKKWMILLLLPLLLAGCSSRTQQDAKYTVVTTIFPAYDWAREILGDDPEVELKLLSEKGVDLHSYQVTAADMVKIAGCDLFIYVGGESDEWVQEALESVPNPNRAQLCLMDALEGHLHQEETIEGMQVRVPEEENEEEPEYDEHVWLSLGNSRILCRSILDSLCTMNPGGADRYRANAEAYTSKLDALDASFRQELAEAPGRTILFCDRFPFRYLVEDYGLTYYAAFSGCSGDSAATFETILFLAEKAEVLPAVLQLEDSGGQMAQAVIGCTGRNDMQVFTLDSLQAVSLKEARSGRNYLNAMQENLRLIALALQ